MGIAVFTVVLLHVYFGRLYGMLAQQGITVTKGEAQQGREFVVLRAEQKGLRLVTPPPRIREVLDQFKEAHVHAFQLTFVLIGVVAIVGATVSWLLVRRSDHQAPTGLFSRRSRWAWVTKGEGPGLTRKPAPGPPGRDG